MTLGETIAILFALFGVPDSQGPTYRTRNQANRNLTFAIQLASKEIGAIDAADRSLGSNDLFDLVFCNPWLMKTQSIRGEHIRNPVNGRGPGAPVCFGLNMHR